MSDNLTGSAAVQARIANVIEEGRYICGNTSILQVLYLALNLLTTCQVVETEL